MNAYAKNITAELDKAKSMYGNWERTASRLLENSAAKDREAVQKVIDEYREEQKIVAECVIPNHGKIDNAATVNKSSLPLGYSHGISLATIQKAVDNLFLLKVDTPNKNESMGAYLVRQLRERGHNTTYPIITLSMHGNLLITSENKWISKHIKETKDYYYELDRPLSKKELEQVIEYFAINY